MDGWMTKEIENEEKKAAQLMNSIQQNLMFHLLTNQFFFLNSSLLLCKAACSLQKDLMCRAADTTQAGFSTSPLPPTGLEV